MRMINVSISDLEYQKFGIQTDKLSFSDFVEIISKEISRQTLNNCVHLAARFGISKMTMEDISHEVKAVRGDAKNHH